MGTMTRNQTLSADNVWMNKEHEQKITTTNRHSRLRVLLALNLRVSARQKKNLCERYHGPEMSDNDRSAQVTGGGVVKI